MKSVTLENTLIKLKQNAGTVRATSTRCLVSLNVTSVKMDMKSQVDHFSFKF